MYFYNKQTWQNNFSTNTIQPEVETGSNAVVSDETDFMV